MTRVTRTLIPVLIMLALALSPACTWVQAAERQYAVGVVFHDMNENGLRDTGEAGIPGIKVSNGRDVVKTDADGRYRISVDDDTVIFITKPRGWMVPVCENNIPRFYYVHKPAGSPPMRFKGVDPTGPLPESIDFPLTPQDEPDRFKVVVFGDTQPNRIEQIYWMGHDVIQELVGVEAAFGTTLGDVVGVNLDLHPDLSASKGLIGIPWWYVKGNHDANYDGRPNHHLTSETWKRMFGPPYYSFEYGPVYFIALNNAYFGQHGRYLAQLDMRQMSWLRRTLSMVPEDQLVVLLMHIGMHRMTNRTEVYDLLYSRPHTFSLSAHTHTQYHNFYGPEHAWEGTYTHHHLVHAAVCGPWWRGWPDELGIPHSLANDGTPNGYSIITFDGNKYSVRYKVARRPADYQMNIWAPDEVSASDAADSEVIVNVFAGSIRCPVEMRVGEGEWMEMERVIMPDPYHKKAYEFQESLTKPVPWRAMMQARNSLHLWKANLPANLSEGANLIHIRTTDIFAQTHEGYRVVHVR